MANNTAFTAPPVRLFRARTHTAERKTKGRQWPAVRRRAPPARWSVYIYICNMPKFRGAAASGARSARSGLGI